MKVGTAKVFMSGTSQAVRLPKDFRFEVDEVRIRKEGDVVILEPILAEAWPKGFFEKIQIGDPGFDRPAQGEIPPIKGLDE